MHRRVTTEPSQDHQEASTAPNVQGRVAAGADKGLRILLIAKDSTSADATTSLLDQAFADRYSLTHATSTDQAAEIMRQPDHDICLLADDVNTDGALEFVRSSLEANERPIIVLAANGNSELDLKVVDSGAADCIPQDELTPEALERSIRHALMREHVAARAKREISSLAAEIGKLNTLRDANHRFVDNACHDFRSPLTVIKEFSSIIAEGLAGEVNEEQSEFLEIILTRVDQLSQMVDSILDASRLESDLISVKREQLFAADAIEQFKPTLEQLATQAKAEIAFTLDEKLPPVFADADSVGRILTNLVTNACKFVGEGGKVEVWARPVEDGSYITIGVTDNGPGIAPEHVKLIFERFKQIEDDEKVEKAGFGLGLHIASELARVNYGTLSVESTPKQGSTFAFTLPVFDVDKIIPLHLSFLDTSRHGFHSISMVMATVQCDAAEEVAEVERYLNRQLRSYDLLLRVKQSNWLACLACDEQDLSNIIERIRTGYAEQNRNRPQGPLPDMGLRAVGSWALSGQNEGLSDAILSAYALGGEKGVH